MREAQSANMEGDSQYFDGGSSRFGTMSPTTNGAKEALCVKDINGDSSQLTSAMQAQHPMDTTTTYKPTVSSATLTRMFKYYTTGTFRGDASDTGHQFCTGATAGSDSIEANSSSDEEDSHASDDVDAPSDSEELQEPVEESGKPKCADNVNASSDSEQLKEPVEESGKPKHADEVNALSDSEQLQEPVEESGKPKRGNVAPTPQPIDQNDEPLEDEPSPPTPQLMNQAMALDSGRNYSVSGRVNIADVDSTQKGKTELSKPLKTRRTDQSLAGQSKAKQVVSQQQQQTTATSVEGGPDNRKRFTGNDSSPIPKSNADESTSINNNGLGLPGDDVGEPPPPIQPHRRPLVEDTQDVVNTENEYVEVSGGGEPLQLLAVHMEPHDSDDPNHPFPAEESEEGSSNPSQFVPSGPP